MITAKRKKNRTDFPVYGRGWGKLNDVFQNHNINSKWEENQHRNVRQDKYTGLWIQIQIFQ